MIYRLWFTKYKNFKYITHFDFIFIIECSIRRANIPIVLTQGFNPRLKIISYSPIPVGVISRKDPLDIFFKEHSYSLEELKNKINNELPSGIEILFIEKIKNKIKKYRGCEIKYIFKLSKEFSFDEEKIKIIKYSKEIIIEKNNKKKDIKKYIKECNLLGNNILETKVIITPNGGISPWDLLKIFNISLENYNLLKIERYFLNFI